MLEKGHVCLPSPIWMPAGDSGDQPTDSASRSFAAQFGGEVFRRFGRFGFHERLKEIRTRFL